MYKTAVCQCGHKIVWYPTYRGQTKIGSWKHTTDNSWFADSCRSAGNSCDCETPKPKDVNSK